MRKVVLNKSFGGFQLSPFAKVEYARRKGIIPRDANVYFYSFPTDEEYYTLGKHRQDDDIVGGYKIKRDETFVRENPNMCYDISIEDFGDKFPYSFFDTGIEWVERNYYAKQNTPKKEIDEHIKRNIDFHNKQMSVMHGKDFLKICECDIARHDADLIAIIEELGADIAGRPDTNLTIEKVNDDQNYIIKEIDGKEFLEVSSDL